MKADDLIEEGPSDGCYCIRVTQRNEMQVFGVRSTTVSTTDSGKTFDRVHGSVCPDRARDAERLQQAYLVKVLGLIALTSWACLDEFRNETVGVGVVEGRSEPV